MVFTDDPHYNKKLHMVLTYVDFFAADLTIQYTMYQLQTLVFVLPFLV